MFDNFEDLKNTLAYSVKKEKSPTKLLFSMLALCAPVHLTFIFFNIFLLSAIIFEEVIEDEAECKIRVLSECVDCNTDLRFCNEIVIEECGSGLYER